MKRRILLSLLLVVVLLIVGGCGGGETAETEPEATDAPTMAPMDDETEPDMDEEPEPAPTSTEPAMDEEPEPGMDMDDETEPGMGDEDSEIDVDEGLEQLESYRAELVMTITSTDAEDQTGSGSMVFSVARDNATQDTEMLIGASGPLFEAQQGPTEMQYYRVEGTSYVLSPMPGTEDPQCMSMPVEEDDVAPDMSDMLGDFDYDAATLVEEGEMVNGVATDHYRIDETEDFQGEGLMTSVESVQVDIWVAQDGDYVVKLDAVMEGTAMPAGPEEIEGTVEVNYNLSQINKPITIELPAACENATEIPGAPPAP